MYIIYIFLNLQFNVYNLYFLIYNLMYRIASFTQININYKAN